MQQFIIKRFGEEGLDNMGENPIVGTNEQPADPHFEPTPENARPIRRGYTVLIDLWAKLDQPGSVFYDITWCGFIGSGPVPEKYREIFNTVRDARKAAVQFIRDRFAAGEPVYGWEVDDACRAVVEDAGYGEYFVHRTGHGIGLEEHEDPYIVEGNEQLLAAGHAYSVEPGIYVPGKWGMRLEDIVVTTAAGPQRLNNSDHRLASVVA